MKNGLKRKAQNLDLKMLVVEDMNIEEMAEFIKKYQILSPDGNELSEPKQFNLLFESEIGSVTW